MKNRTSGSKNKKAGDSPSQLIDARIDELSDWRGETYRNAVKMTLRAIDLHEGDKVDGKALKALVRAAVALNTGARA